MPKRTKYSAYFDIFKDKATCQKCGAVINLHGGSTSGMKYHAEKVHEVDFGDKAAPEKIPKPNLTRTLDSFVQIKKPPLEELVSKEASRGATFEYIATSELLHDGIKKHGYNPPKSHNTVRSYVRKSAENHRKVYRDKFQALKKKGQRFCVIADEWTCTSKKRKYLNVILHLKGREKILIYEVRNLPMEGF